MDVVHILTADQMHCADQACMASGTSQASLMGRAGQAVASAVIARRPATGRVVIITGAGNNGGDGFSAAAYLQKSRIAVTVVSLVSTAEIAGESREQLSHALACGVKVREARSGEMLGELERWLNRSVMVVDAIFGTGLSRPIDGFIHDVITRINSCGRPVLSVDIASGICADTGHVLGVAVKADMTLPIAALKWGHWLAEGRDYTGMLLPAADIGISDALIRASWERSADAKGAQERLHARSSCLIDDGFLARSWGKRPRLSHKGSFGHVWVLGGSVGYTGAPQLAALGAYAAGAGLASVVCPDEVWPVVAAANLEVMSHPESSACWQQADALVAGPGWGRKRAALLATLLTTTIPMVIDADALNIIAADQPLQKRVAERAAMTVMTPHPGEAARLLAMTTEEVQADRKEAVLALVDRYRCWVVLKGSETLIVSPDRDIYLNPFGSPRLAVAGSGDVLSGIIAAQLAKGESPDIVIPAAVALHGKAGEKQGWYLAGELAKAVACLRQSLE